MPSPAVTMAVVLLIGASGAIVGFLVRAMTQTDKKRIAPLCRQRDEAGDETMQLSCALPCLLRAFTQKCDAGVVCYE